MDLLKACIRDIPDFPKPGIMFKDITPALKEPEAFRSAIDELIRLTDAYEYDLICGIESRGFIFGSAMAYKTGKGFVPVRKPGKLPYQTIQEAYSLEYGTNVLEIHGDAVAPGQKVLVVDDLLATGGTASATGTLIERLRGQIAGYAFVIELEFLDGRKRLQNGPVISLLRY